MRAARSTSLIVVGTINALSRGLFVWFGLAGLAEGEAASSSLGWFFLLFGVVCVSRRQRSAYRAGAEPTKRAKCGPVTEDGPTQFRASR